MPMPQGSFLYRRRNERYLQYVPHCVLGPGRWRKCGGVEVECVAVGAQEVMSVRGGGTSQGVWGRG